ncbi:MAG: hypothetical protein J5929_11225 [Eubacterium sp.]|nr:hypothetical protein [Eubacterium sp.]
MQNNNTVSKNRVASVLRFFDGSLRSDLLIMVVFCFAGVLCKKLINPVANAITGALHIPGGISTAVALMFLVIAASLTKRKWSASAMGMMQAAMALAMGSMGSMGLLRPLAYLIPGIVIDLVMLIPEGKSGGLFTSRAKAFFANILSSVSAALFADLVVFHLPTKPLMAYLCVAALSGAVCGFVAGAVVAPIKDADEKRGKNEEG